MKSLIFLLTLLLSTILLAQNSESVFSQYYFGILGGTNFNTLPTAGTAISLEVKSNITSNIYAKLSIGYSTLYDDNSYEVKYYKFVDFDEKYHTVLLAVDRVKYTIVPINIGVEYTLLKSRMSPFTLIEFGYNYSSSETEGKNNDGIAGSYSTLNEVPEEYRQTVPTLEDGSSLTMGIGLGVKYLLTDRMDLNIRYVYHYNESIINNNQVLIGITF